MQFNRSSAAKADCGSRVNPPAAAGIPATPVRNFLRLEKHGSCVTFSPHRETLVGNPDRGQYTSSRASESMPIGATTVREWFPYMRTKPRGKDLARPRSDVS